MNTIIKQSNDWDVIFRNRPTDTIGYPAMQNPFDTLYLKGTNVLVEKKDTPRILITGTRDMSLYGKDCTQRIVNAISRNPQKPIIISGLAIGIDAVAHRAAIDTGLPTVAVVATGLDTVYPFVNTGLHDDIIKNGGSIITLFPEKTAPVAINFLTRNKLMATIADYIIVVESKTKGGSILTAKYGADIGCTVYAVPGRVGDVRSLGCNDLILNQYAEILPDFEVFSEPIF